VKLSKVATSLFPPFVLSFILCCFLVAMPGCGGGGSGGVTLTGIDIAPISPSVAVGGQQQFTATGDFSDGSKADLTTNATWSSNATNIATIENIGTHPGLATGVSEGTAQITVSFAQGSSNVTASTDLSVTAGNTVPPEGVAAVSFSAGPDATMDGLKVDGRELPAFSERITFSLELPAGLHRITSPDGRHTFTIILEGQRNYSFEVLASGRLALSDGKGGRGN
jgi:Bacterial Ig-like domain (group 2)